MKRVGDTLPQINHERRTSSIPDPVVKKLGVLVEGAIFPWAKPAETYQEVKLSHLRDEPDPVAVKTLIALSKLYFRNQVFLISRLETNGRRDLEAMLARIGLVGDSITFDPTPEYVFRDRTVAAARGKDLSHFVGTDQTELIHMQRVVPNRFLLDPTHEETTPTADFMVASNWAEIAGLIIPASGITQLSQDTQPVVLN